jgi:hypothetical protein
MQLINKLPATGQTKIVGKFNIMAPLFSLLILVSNYDTCKTNKVMVDATLLDSNVISEKQVELKVKISNFSGNALQVPDLLFLGLKNDPYADFVLEIEKKENTTNFIHIEIPDNYLPAYRVDVLKKLSDKGSLDDRFNIAQFYNYRFPKGSYRTRVLYKVSKHNPISDIYSNWVKFTIK